MHTLSRLTDTFRSRCCRALRLFAIAVTLSTAVALACAAQETPPAPPQSPGGYALSCSVLDAHGRPVSGVALELAADGPAHHFIRAETGSDGAFTFLGLPAGAYNLSVAGGILLPPKRVQLGAGFSPSIAFALPMTLPPVPGHNRDVVSVQQLNVPERLQEITHKAFDAWARNDFSQARTQAQRALQMRPNYGPALSLLGFLSLQEGHAGEAVAGLLLALQHNPDSQRTYLALASAFNQLHQYTDALDALSLMSKLVSQSWQLHYETGRAYLGQGRFQDALTEFDRARSAAQQDIVVLHVGRSHALLGLKDYAGSRAELETVLRKDRHGPYAAESRELALLLDSYLKQPPRPLDASAHNPNPASVDH